MCLEPPESGLLSRPPRNVRKERLANWRLLLQAYGFLGIIESLCAMSMSVHTVFLLSKRFKFSDDGPCPGRFGTCNAMAYLFRR
jgi:hypothetical protein